MYNFPNGEEHPIVKGTHTDKLLFPRDVFPLAADYPYNYDYNYELYTFFHVTSYDPYGSHFERIWTAHSNNWLSG